MLDARQLEALAAVVEHGGFGPAAKALHLTLAAVSQRIKALESELGARLLVRGKTVHATAAGQALLAHVKQVRAMESDLLADMQGASSVDGGAGGAARAWQTLAVAVNVDSVASWFLPGIAPLLKKQRLLLDIVIDDQDYTHAALKSGDVLGCVTTLARPLRGCLAEPLGRLHYHAVAAPALAKQCKDRQGKLSAHQLLAQPAVIFNRKDALSDAWLEQHFGLHQPPYPRHFAPSNEAYHTAIALGLGWGMVPAHDLKTHGKAYEELLPGVTVDVALYWQHWTRESPSAQRLTEAVKAAA